MILAATVTVLCALVSLVWISRNIMVSVERRKGFALDDSYPVDASRQPPITVVVAAKDEEENIGECLRSMLAQDYPHLEMILCNDRSTDRTAEIASQIAAEDTRLRLVNIEYLPEGWAGKNNAMQNGIRQATNEWICMIDADCTQTSPRSLAAAMQYAQDTGADLLSVLPSLEMKGFWENAIQPVCSGVMMIWFHPDKVNSPRHTNAYANGAFMLIKRSAYEKIGTHESVKQCVNEDMHMAARVKACGLKLRVVRNRELYTVRMYTTLRQMFRGWSRIFYGTFVTFRRIALSLTAVLFVSVLPYLAAVLGWTMFAAGAAPHSWWLACSAAATAAVALQLVAIFRFYRLIGGHAWMAWSYLIGAVFATAALCTALGKLRKGAKIVWRNTSYVSTAGKSA